MRFITKCIRLILLAVFFTGLLCIVQTANSQADPGDLDTSFGTDGIVTNVTAEGGSGNSIAIQADGKIVVAGDAYIDGTQDFAAARFNSDGSLDTSFGVDGIVTTSVSAEADAGSSIAIQADGKIVVAGSDISIDFSTSTPIFTSDFAAVRYNSDGSLDTSFGVDGIVTTNITDEFDVAFGIAVQADGKIVVAGDSSTTDTNDSAVVRYNSDGSLDTSFGVDGIVTTSVSAEHDGGRSIAIQADGKIVVAGYTASDDRTTGDFAVVRYNSDGSLDTSFDADGIVTTSVSTDADAGNSIAIQTDGKIVVAGSANLTAPSTPSSINPSDFAVVRYNSDGSLDTSFGVDGIVTTSVSAGGDAGFSIAIQADGRIVVAGRVNAYSSGTGDFALVRYNSDGSLDTSFGVDGIVTTSVSAGGDAGFSIAIQADDKIVVAGQAAVSSGLTGDFAVIRYIADSSLSIENITVKSKGCTIYNVASPEIPTGAPSDFTAIDCVSFTAIDVHIDATISITFPSKPEIVYKSVGGEWMEIYPANESTGITDVTLDGNTLTFTIADNSDCDEDDTTGIIHDPIVAGSLIEVGDGGDVDGSGDGGGGGCFISNLF